MAVTQDAPTQKFELPAVKDGEFHVFITYNKEDQADKDFAEDLAINTLEKKYRFKVFLLERDSTAGKGEIENIALAIEKSHKTIIILSRSYLKENWTKFEGSLAAHKVMKSGQQTIIPIVYNTETSKLRDEEIPVKLSMYNYINADLEHFEERLISAYAANISLEDALPSGNVAYGLAWSYFYGYLNLILNNLPERIERCEDIWHPQNRKTCRKMFILIPKSCYCPAKFGEADARISDECQLEQFVATRAGNIKRPYPAFAKKITMAKEGDKEDVYYFIGEFATPILSMYEMERERISGLSQTQKYEQVLTFYRTLKDILNHKNAKHCHGKVILHYFDDAPEANGGKPYPLADKLVEMIKESINNEVTAETEGSAV